MNKEWFNGQTDHIEVPVEELFSAIDKGIEKGRKNRKSKWKAKVAVSIASLAASLLLISGFVFSPMTKVLASVPVIGSIYDSLQMKIGQELEAKNLVATLNQTASDHGVDITLTSAYYDGVYIGITFKAEGEGINYELVKEDLGADYDFYLYEEHGVKGRWGGSIGDLQKVDNYYVSAIEMQYPDKQLPKEFAIPIIFTMMGGVEGIWQFEVPVTQLPLKTFTFEKSTSQDEKHSFTLESIVTGESNTRLDYTTSIPEDFLNFKIIDDKGNELAEDTLRIFSSEYAVFETGIGDTKYLMIYPVYREVYRDVSVLIELEPIKVKVQDN